MKYIKRCSLGFIPFLFICESTSGFHVLLLSIHFTVKYSHSGHWLLIRIYIHVTPHSRVECSVCSHSWFQSKDRLITLNDGLEFTPLPDSDISRINANVQAGRDAAYLGEVKFYVGNLSFQVTEEDLKGVFEKVGPVGDVSIVVGPDGRNRGFAFVTMLNKEDEDACLKLDGYELLGRSMNVKAPNN